MLLETLNSITGERADSELTQEIKELVTAYPEVRGAYDLTLHNYGPTSTIGSVHIEVDDAMIEAELGTNKDMVIESYGMGYVKESLRMSEVAEWVAEHAKVEE